MNVTVTDQGSARFKLDVEVSGVEVDRRVEQAAGRLGEELKIPGFRKGKVPAPIVIGRVGREVVLEQALRDSLGEWYSQAIVESDLDPVGEPDFEVGELPDEGEPLTFTIELAVRPPAKLGDYKGIEVGRREPEVPEADIEAELNRLREAFGRLEAVERKAGKGDFAVVDFAGSVDGEPIEDGEARDHPIELGAGQMIEGFEERLIGLEAGNAHEFDIEFPDDYASEKLAGKTAHFEITVKAVQEKRLPELDDDFASEAAGLESVDELRSEIESKLRETIEHQVESEYREAAIDAAVKNAKISLDEELSKARAGDMWHGYRHRLSHQGISPEQYLQITGKTEAEMLEELLPQAEQSLKRESVLEAVADAEGIEISEADLLGSIAQADQRHDHDHDHEGEHAHDPQRAEQVLRKLKESGRDRSLKRELRLGKAAELIVEQATPISTAKAEAREKLWTPGEA